MSGESGEAAVRAAIDAWNAGGVEGFLERLTPDVKWHPPPGFPEGELFSGRDAVAAALSEQFKTVFTSGRVEVRSVTGGTDGWLVVAHHEVEGQASGMDLAWRVYIVFQLEGDLICEMWAFLEREDAERQAGA